MSNIANTIKEKIKKENKELLKLIESNNVSDETLVNNMGPIYEYLNQEGTEDYVMEINVSEDNIEFDYIPKSSEAKRTTKLANVRQQYLLTSLTDEQYLLDLNDLVKEKGRYDLFKKIEDMLSQIKEGKKPRGYYVWGDYGIGKTVISIALLNKLALMGYTVAHTSWTDIFRKLKAGMGDTSMEYMIDLMVEADVLFVDDLGGEKVSSWSREEIMFPILNKRQEANKITLFTSNLPLNKYEKTLYIPGADKELEQNHVGRIMERMYALVDEIHLEGPNFRKIK